MYQTLMDGLRQLVFPDNCFLCRNSLLNNHQQQLCNLCASQLKLNVPPFCGKCSKHLAHFTADGLCATCSGNDLDVDRLWGCCLYEEPLVKLIAAFKYHSKTSLGRTFVPLMQQFITSYHLDLNDIDYIAPIPLHPLRLRERGYNQAQILSLGLSKALNLPHVPDLLLRIKATASQTTFSQKQRWTNMDGAFKINPSKSVADKSILLVDDLLTTQATAHAAARALKEAGSASVSIITLAIA